METEKVIIIGAGLAGATSAIQMKRYGIPFILLEKERVGGLLWNANLVENYPGFPAGVTGPKLVQLIKKQMVRVGIEVVYENVLRVTNNPQKNIFHIRTQNNHYTTPNLIIASGTHPMPIPLDIPENCKNKVFSDIWPLLKTQDKKIIIIGAGDAAFDYALNLVKRRNFVTILNRGGEVKCLELLWKRAKAEPSIEYRAETPISVVEFDGLSNGLRVHTDAGESIEADYLIFAIGRIPQTDFLSDELVNQKVKGLYFVGDVKNGLYRQAAIAAGDGLRAAMDIFYKINSEAKLS